MSTRCLICNSSAVVSTETVRAVVLLISTLHGFLQVARQLQPQSTDAPPGDSTGLGQVLALITNGVKKSTQEWSESQSFLQDMQRFQFMQYNCFCLRCGAKFDEPSDI